MIEFKTFEMFFVLVLAHLFLLGGFNSHADEVCEKPILNPKIVNGMLVLTKKGHVLAMGDHVAFPHSDLKTAIEKKKGAVRRIVWVGELKVVNGGTTNGNIAEANQTSGSYGRKIPPDQSTNTLANLEATLRKSAPGLVATALRLIPYDDRNRHLDQTALDNSGFRRHDFKEGIFVVADAFLQLKKGNTPEYIVEFFNQYFVETLAAIKYYHDQGLRVFSEAEMSFLESIKHFDTWDAVGGVSEAATPLLVKFALAREHFVLKQVKLIELK